MEEKNRQAIYTWTSIRCFFGVLTKNMTQARSREHNKRGDTKIQKNNTKKKKILHQSVFQIFLVFHQKQEQARKNV